MTQNNNKRTSTSSRPTRTELEEPRRTTHVPAESGLPSHLIQRAFDHPEEEVIHNLRPYLDMASELTGQFLVYRDEPTATITPLWLHWNERDASGFSMLFGAFNWFSHHGNQALVNGRGEEIDKISFVTVREIKTAKSIAEVYGAISDLPA